MRSIRGLAAFCCFCLSGCGSHRAVAQQAAAEPSSAIPAATLRDTSLFLAGLRGPADSQFHELEQTQSWQAYADRFDTSWAALEREQFAPVRAFQARELKPMIPADVFLFYPFSGPDVLYATLLFPQTRIYMLAGLEPVGRLKQVTEYQTASLPAELAAWRGVFNSVFHRSFFITGEMQRQMKDGLLPVMLALLARNGFTTTSVRTGSISPEGEFVVPVAAEPAILALELRFHGAEGGQRVLYYASANLGEPYSAEKSVGLFVHKLGKPVTFIKSASFLPHQKSFAALRNQILASSAAILQDDTGVPFRFLHGPEWDVRLYGNYTAPDRGFRNQLQKDLAAAFAERTEPLPLDFPIGYGFRRRGSSLIMAVRK